MQERTQVFISYSHANAKWLKQLHIHLKPLEREGRIERWDDIISLMVIQTFVATLAPWDITA